MRIDLTLEDAQDIIERFAPGPYYWEAYRGMEASYMPALCSRLETMRAGRRALDIGPGWGTIPVWLALRGWQVMACDSEPFGQWITEALLHYAGFEFMEHDVSSGPVPLALDGARYDLVTMTQVLPHLKYRADQALGNAVSALAPGGTMIVSALDADQYPQAVADATYGTHWQEVPYYGQAPPSSDMVVAMFTRSAFSGLLSDVLDAVVVWNVGGVMFGMGTSVD